MSERKVPDSDWRDSCPTIQDKQLHLLKSGELSDVVFLVGENEVPIQAHKFILILASPVFEVQFSERWNKENKIKIPDVTPKAFQMFLKFLYTEEFTISEEEAEDILSLSHKYMVKPLSKLTSDRLAENIKVSNVLHIYRIANKFGIVEESLQNTAMEFILMEGSSVLQDIGFLDIDPNTLSTILKNDKLRADEITVFRALMGWAENRCQVEKLDCTVHNKRIVLNDLIQLISFNLMSPQDFTNEVICGEHEGILSDAETVVIFKHWHAGPSVRSLLPPLPFSVSKRHGGSLHMLVMQESEVRKYVTAQHCRFKYGSHTKTNCEKIFQFRSNRNICIKAIGLRQSINLKGGHSIGYLVFNESGSAGSEMCISISLSEEKDTLAGKFLPQITQNIDSLNGFRIENDKTYNIKLVIGNIDGSSDVVASGAGLRLSNPVLAVGEEDLIVTFTTVSSQCHWRGKPGVHYCMCHGQIKAIYFTF